MDAVRITSVIEKDGEIRLTGLPYKKGESVEAILLSSGRKPLTAGDLLNSEVVGMWADRDDIGDSVEFARKLRREAETR